MSGPFSKCSSTLPLASNPPSSMSADTSWISSRFITKRTSFLPSSLRVAEQSSRGTSFIDGMPPTRLESKDRHSVSTFSLRSPVSVEYIRKG